MPPNQHDIAKKLGVSQRTVSAVLTNTGRISNATRKRVLEEIRKSDYRPNRLASGLRGSPTRSMGVIWPIADPWAGDASISLEVISRFQDHEYVVYTAAASDDDKSLGRQIDELASRSVDALLLYALPGQLRNPEILDRLRGIPALVAVSREVVPEFPGDIVVHDRTQAIREVVKHLAKQGRMRPAFMLNADQESNPPKLMAFREACREFGIPDHPHLHIPLEYPEDPDEHGERHRAALRKIFPDSLDVDALFCFNDIGALYVMRELMDRNIRIPEDVAVIGFNNTLAGRIWDPPLATGDRCPHQVADRAFELLMSRLRNEKDPRQVCTVSMQFIHRESAG